MNIVFACLVSFACHGRQISQYLLDDGRVRLGICINDAHINNTETRFTRCAGKAEEADQASEDDVTSGATCLRELAVPVLQLSCQVAPLSRKARRKAFRKLAPAAGWAGPDSAAPSE